MTYFLLILWALAGLTTAVLLITSIGLAIFKKNSKKLWIGTGVSAIAFVLLFFSTIFSNQYDINHTESTASNDREFENNQEPQTTELYSEEQAKLNEEATEKSEEQETGTAASEEEYTEEVTDEPTEELAAERPEEIADLNLSDVRNDNTGEWQIATTSKDVNMPENAKAYYDAYMGEDGNHYIVSFATNTTIQLNAMSGTLFVTITEYQDGEEHDASQLGSGMIYGDYLVNIKDGTVEEL